jgi:hypothetical protein
MRPRADHDKATPHAELAEALLTAVQSSLSKCLAQLFVESQDPRFRRGSNSGDLYTRYDALDALDTYHDSIGHDLMAQVKDGFLNPDQNRDAQPSPPEDPYALWLIEPDELELEQAIQPLAQNLERTHESELPQLEARLSELNTGLTEPVDTRGFHPCALIKAFQKGIARLSLRVPGKLLLCELFEKRLSPGLGELYAHLNRMLHDQGVLADAAQLESAILTLRKRPRSRRHPTGDEDVSDPLKAPEQDLAEALESTPAPQAKAAPPTLSEGEFLDILSVEPNAPGTGSTLSSYQRFQIISALSLIQRKQVDSDLILDIEEIKRAIGRTLYDSGVFNAAELIEHETHVIDFVNEIFTTLRQDAGLPDALKSLIDKLQVPTIKLALLDFEFFKNREHPARELLNHITTLAEGIGIDDQTLASRLKAIVDKILRRFNTNLAALDEPLKEIRELARAEAERIRRIEARSRRQAEKEARRDNARQYVKETIMRHSRGRGMPPKLRNFLWQCWAPYMASLYIEHGPHGSDWEEACYILRQLIEASCSVNSVAAFDLLIGSIDALFDRMEQRLGERGILAGPRQEVLGSTRRWFAAYRYRLGEAETSLGAESPPAPHQTPQTNALAPQGPPSLIRRIVHTLTGKTRLGPQPKPEEAASSPQPEGTLGRPPVPEAPHSDGQLRYDDHHGIEVPTGPGGNAAGPEDEMLFDDQHGLSEPETVPPVADALSDEDVLMSAGSGHGQDPTRSTGPAGDTAGDGPLELPVHVRPGTWYEVFQAEDGPKRRLKLSAILRDTGQVLFANRSGEGELIIDLETFLEDLSEGQTTPIVESNLFDQALSSVIRNIREAQEQRMAG